MDRPASEPEDLLVFYVLAFLQLAAGHGVVIGDRAPEGDFVGLDDRPVSLAPAEITAVSFFATWCRPCHDAISDLLAIHESRGGFKILLVAIGEDPTKVRGFVKAWKLPGDVLVALDPTAAGARAWGQERFPTTFFVDGSRMIRHINRGYGKGFRQRVERWLRSMQRGE